LVTAVRELFAAGVELFDVQFLTPHLVSLGAYEVRRVEYLTRIGEAKRKAVRLTGLAFATHSGDP
jgi:leucyl/phenylalanyl-tRNA--protein transferase